MPKFHLTYQDFIGPNISDAWADIRHRCVQNSGIQFSSPNGTATGFSSEIISLARQAQHPPCKSQNDLITWFYYFMSDDERNFNIYDIREITLQFPFTKPKSNPHLPYIGELVQQNESLASLNKEYLSTGLALMSVEILALAPIVAMTATGIKIRNKRMLDRHLVAQDTSLNEQSWRYLQTMLTRSSSFNYVSINIPTPGAPPDFFFARKTISLVSESEINYVLEIPDEIYTTLLNKNRYSFSQFKNFSVHISNDRQITPEMKLRLFDLLRRLSNLEELDLRRCSLTDNDFLTLINDVILPNNQTIKILNLSGNQISYTGTRYLASNAKRLVKLEIIDLSDNRIACTSPLFQRLSQELFQIPKLAVIKIEHNFISRECKKQYFNKLESGRYQYNQYQTTLLEQPTIRSLLSRSKEISRQVWLVALVCRKGTEHAMIYMEGMKKWGQRFFERYHITARGFIGIANVLVDEPELKFFDETHYFMEIREISKIKGKILRELISNEQNRQISFSIFSPASYRNTTNCLHWCLAQLAMVDIKIDPNIFGLPSRTAQGLECTIQ